VSLTVAGSVMLPHCQLNFIHSSAHTLHRSHTQPLNIDPTLKVANGERV
jgi:hypothetical protein